MRHQIPSSLGGLDEFAQRIVHRRWKIFCKHIERWLIPYGLWDIALLDPTRHGDIAQRINEVRRAVTYDPSDNYTEKAKGWSNWVAKYMLPLARELDIWEVTYRQTWEQDFKHCWSHGLFDVPRSQNKPSLFKRPDYQLCLTRVQAVFQEHTSTHTRMSALCEQGLCSDRSLAASAAQHLGRIDEEAALATWDVVYSALTESLVHLLRYSAYPCPQELLLIQRHIDVIRLMTKEPEQVIGKLRAVISALYHSLTAPNVIQLMLSQKGLPSEIPDPLPENLTRPEWAHYRQAQNIARSGLWRQDFMHRPPHDPARITYRGQLNPQVKTLVLQELQTRLPNDGELAEVYLNSFCEDNLSCMVDLVCGIPPGQIERTFAMQRICIALDTHLGWIDQADRREIEWLLICLQETIYALQLPIPLFPLVDTYPGNDCRKQFKKWLRNEPRIILEFSKRAGIQQEDGSARLYALGSYAAFGLLRLQQDRLYQIIPRPIAHYIHFLKLSHPSEHLDQMRVQTLTNEIAVTCGMPALSPQVTRALFNRLKKEGHWNSGSGDTTDPLVKQPSPYLPKVPRLLRALVFVPFSLDLRVIDETTSQISNQCYGVLILDHDGVLPMGCWISNHLVGPPELGLALYQSIWHVGNVWWPIRGVPDTILLPLKSLGLDNENIADLHRAAHFMMSKVEANDREAYWRKQRIVRQFCDELPAEVRRNITNGYPTCAQVQNVALSWLYRVPLRRALDWGSRKEEQDKRQTADGEITAGIVLAQTADSRPLEEPQLKTQRATRLPSTLWSHGFAMPGYDSPAAGWLLPRASGTAQMTTEGLLLGSNLYTSSFASIPSGTELFYRRFPASYATIEPALFAEYQGYPYYFTRTGN